MRCYSTKNEAAETASICFLEFLQRYCLHLTFVELAPGLQHASPAFLLFCLFSHFPGIVSVSNTLTYKALPQAVFWKPEYKRLVSREVPLLKQMHTVTWWWPPRLRKGNEDYNQAPTSRAQSSGDTNCRSIWHKSSSCITPKYIVVPCLRHTCSETSFWKKTCY